MQDLKPDHYFFSTAVAFPAPATVSGVAAGFAIGFSEA